MKYIKNKQTMPYDVYREWQHEEVVKMEAIYGPLPTAAEYNEAMKIQCKIYAKILFEKMKTVTIID